MAKKTAKKKETKEEPKKVLTIEDKLKKKFGDQAFTTGRYITEAKKVIVPVSPVIDCMLGGGIPFGSFVIPTGPPKVGKTVTALDMAATALKIPSEFENKRHLYFFNIEGRLNARDLAGIHHMIPHIDEDVTVIGSYPGKIYTAEDYLDIGEQLINEKPGCIFIFDSFSQLCSKSGRANEWDGKAYRDDVPKMLSQFCKRISNVIPINKSIVVGITHQIANTGFGFSAWAEASGTKIQYQVDVKLKAWSNDWKDGETDTVIGKNIEWQCLCSPLLNGPNVPKCTSKFRYGYGLDKPLELVNMAIDLGIIRKAGSWYYFPDESKVQGIESARPRLMEDDVLYQTVNEKYRDMMGLPSVSI